VASPRPRELLQHLPSPEELRALALGLFSNNLGFKLLSLFVAMVIWAWVQEDREVEVSKRAAIILDIPDNLAFTRPPQASARVSISGPQGVIREMSELALELDLSELEPGSPILELDAALLKGVPPGVTVLNMVPNSLQVELERKVARQLLLKPSPSQAPPDGYRLVSVELDPPSIEVRGPASLVEEQDGLRTEVIDISKLTESTRLPVSVNLPPQLERSDDTPIFAEVQVEPVTTERHFPEVPVLVRRPGWIASVDSISVTLEGPVAMISEIAPDDVTAIVLIPNDTPPQQITVRNDPSKAARFEISYRSSEEGVIVSRVAPNSFTVEPEE
jgi:hypothetical protein